MQLGGNQDEGPAPLVRPAYSVCPFAAIRKVRFRKCISDNNSIRNGGVHRSKVVVDVSVGKFRRHDRLERARRRRDLRRYDTIRLHT